MEECEGATGPERIVYVPAESGASLRAQLQAVSRQPAWVGELEALEEVDWSQLWKQGITATVVSERLMIRPSFVDAARQPGQVEIVIDPGQAFGTGGHASTLLALEWIDEVCASSELGIAADARVLDVGTGSGVLALAALALGAGRAVGFDLDPAAVREARRWAAHNGCGDRLGLFTGPIAALAADPFALVVANLLRSELLPIAADVAARVAPGGLAIFSGLLAGDRGAVVSRFVNLGLEEAGVRRTRDAGGDEWISILMRRG